MSLDTYVTKALIVGEGGHEWVKHGNNAVKQMRVMENLLNQHGLAMIRTLNTGFRRTGFRPGGTRATLPVIALSTHCRLTSLISSEPPGKRSGTFV